MKLRDNFAIFPAALVGLTLEIFILYFYWAAKAGSNLEINSDAFMLRGQIYLLAACATSYLCGRILIRPLESILEGISLYGKGQLHHRIQRSKLRELDRLAEHLNRMAAKLAEFDTLKNDFIANVSHELRSPLAAMEGYVILLLARSSISGKDHDNLLRVNNNLIRLRRLVENLLDVSQIEARGMQVQTEPFNLDDAIKEVCALLAPQIEARHLKLELKLAQDLPDANADSAKVRQILTNLVDNAVKYNRENGQLTVSVRADSDTLRVSIRDAGPGIPPEHLENIFERFRRLPTTSPEIAKIKGVGLGLAISRGLARAMGGNIWAESTVGVGSSFILTLPATRKAP